jgi:hypothetical protein
VKRWYQLANRRAGVVDEIHVSQHHAALTLQAEQQADWGLPNLNLYYKLQFSCANIQVKSIKN